MMLRLLLIGVAATSGAVSPAQAQSLLCDNGAEERIVEVIKPGNVGKACDLRILSDGGETISVPYNANNQESYCEARIPDVVKMLAASNFECAVTQTFADAQAQATSDSSNGEVSVADVAPAPTPETDAVASAIMSASDPVEAQSFSDAAEESVYGELESSGAIGSASAAGSLDAQYAAEDFEASVETAYGADEGGSDQFAQNELSEATALLDQPVSAPENTQAADQEVAPYGGATGAPLQLAEDRQFAQLNAPRPARPAAGLVAAPAPTTSAEPIVERVIVSPGRPLTSERAIPKQTTASPSAAELIGAGRPATEIIRSVLMAQVAAWNDGDMEAFLAGYWNDPELRFVSGNEVTIGWRNVAKRYRERYASPEQMGVLRFTEIDVDLVDNGVAVVVGRFSHQSADGAQDGSFSLVMRQIGGLWRIVHDHTTTEGAAAAMRDL